MVGGESVRLSELVRNQRKYLDKVHAVPSNVVYRAVNLHVLDPDYNEIPGAYGTGVVIQNKGKHFLCTCWHVLTGIDPNDIRIGPNQTPRAYLRARLFKFRPSEINEEDFDRQIFIPLFHNDDFTNPRWLQEPIDVEQATLNSVGIKVPASWDFAMLEIPTSFASAGLSAIAPNGMSPWLPGLCSTLIIAGYPYSYNASDHPLVPYPIAYKRNVAAVPFRSTTVSNSHQLLIEGDIAPGMSGSPAFLLYGEFCYLVGLYRGNIYPDHVHERGAKYNEHTALGVVETLDSFWLDKV